LIHSNGQRVLDSLGLYQSFLPTMRLTQKIVVEQIGGATLSVNDLAKLPVPFNQAAVVLRYQLQEQLLEAARTAAIEVSFNHRCVALTQSGNKINLQFDNGQEAQFDCLIACDGVNSKVREAARIAHKKVNIGEAWIRGIADLRSEDSTIRELWGN